jgi:hypothetical protein
MLWCSGFKQRDSACVNVDPRHSGQAVCKDGQQNGRGDCVSQWVLTRHMDLLLEVNQAKNDG